MTRHGQFLIHLLLGAVLCLLPFAYLLPSYDLALPSCLAAAALLVVLLSVWVVGRVRSFSPSWADLAVFLYFAYGVLQCLLAEGGVPASLFASWTLVLAAYVLSRSLRLRCLPLLLGFACLLQALVALGQAVGFFSARHAQFSVTGSFWNPAPLGGFLACFLPLLAACVRSRWRSPWALLLLLPVAVALLLSDSRAAWLAVGVGVLFVFRLFPRRPSWVLSFLLVGVVVLVVLYAYKPASALGRLWVWRIAAGMVAARPCFGSGIHSFASAYMPAQAGWFAAHPDSSFAATAGVVSTPYNEFVHLLVEQGVGGFALLLFLLFTLFRSSSPATDRPLRGVLLAFLVFASFSYPAECVAILFPLALCLGQISSRPLPSRLPARFFGRFVVLLLVGMFCADIAVFGHYRSLASSLRRPLSSARLADFRHEPDALQYLLMKNRRLSPLDRLRLSEWLATASPAPKTYCALGLLWEKRGGFSEAERLYRLAADMVPNQVWANYRLFKLYDSTGRISAAVRMASHIVRQPVKIENSFTLAAQGEAMRYLSTFSACVDESL